MLSGDCGDTAVTVPAKGSAPTGAPSGTAVNRIAGADRYSVAVNISQNWTPGVPVVYIAKGTDYPDALSAAPAAVVGGGPLLLVMPNAIPAVVLAELQRLQPKKIVVVGGEGSVQPAVYLQLSTLTPSIVRLAGATRYEASRNVVSYAFGATGAPRVYVATGQNFPDALSASAAAGTRGAPVLLVPGNDATVAQETTDLIKSLHPNDVAIAGGPGSVSSGIQTALSGLGLPSGVTRLTGADRFDASRNINHDTFTAANQVFLATGLNFPDALAGAPFAGRLSAPLYVIPGSCIPQNILADIQAMAPAQITILGGPASVSGAAESLTPCPISPTGSVAFTCSPAPSLTATVSNPNSFAITLTIRLASGAATSAVVPAHASGTYAGPTPAEDTNQYVSLSYSGGTFLTTGVHRDCTAPPVTPPPGPPANPGDTKNCGDFSTHAAAQAWFNYYYPYYGDIARLDQDNDLIACEQLP
ncbi:cell wall-binding repeat-containing protein [Leifsonia poae]|uniref:cell wall-binding repeat-containing protein n=1 Tax=Leifsonia poae TaxID=110933 RepID=UPI003D663C41